MPGLFEQFPHTNLHELNLDWIIDLLNQFKEELEDSAVLSVNGQTGHVTLYESENVILPALPEGVEQWRLVRMMDGQYAGILFYNGNVYLQRGNETMRLLTLEDIPTSAGVVTWNGMTGIVNATGEDIPVDDTADANTIAEAIENTVSEIEELSDRITELEGDRTLYFETVEAFRTFCQNMPLHSSALVCFATAVGLEISGISAYTTARVNRSSSSYVLIQWISNTLLEQGATKWALSTDNPNTIRDLTAEINNKATLIESVLVTGNSTASMTLEANSCYLLVADGNASTRQGLILIHTTSVISAVDISLGSSITHTENGLVITFSNSSSTNCRIRGMKL